MVRGETSWLLPRLWARRRRISYATGNFQGRVLFSLVYFVIVPLFALLVRVLMDPLQARKRPRKTFWLAYPSKEASLANARRQF